MDNGEIDESIQVSNTSSSGINSSQPHSHACLGLSWVGSIGKSSTSGRITFPQSLQYHTGIGVANILCLEIHQSHSMESAQLTIRDFMCSGTQFISSAAVLVFSIKSLTATNHCFLTNISIGVLHLQHWPTFWSTCSCFNRYPSAFRSSMVCFLQVCKSIPSYLPEAEVNVPVSSIALMISKSYFWTQLTSVLSPKVQIITAPVPNSGSTSSSAIILTFWCDRGTSTYFPKRWVYLSSSGCITTATQADINSGRVVAINIPSSEGSACLPDACEDTISS